MLDSKKDHEKARDEALEQLVPGAVIQMDELKEESKAPKRESVKIRESQAKNRDVMERSHIWAYSVGHLNNDLGAAVFSVYMTYYLISVVQLDPTMTGLVFLIG